MTSQNPRGGRPPLPPEQKRTAWRLFLPAVLRDRLLTTQGIDPQDIGRQLVAWYLREPGAELPERPPARSGRHVA